jgi:NAD(P)-dependent dehydrogenase (short-subunit alcohol dehydrogenase family)
MSPVALVTGGTRGIGRACVDALARDGFKVVFSGRDKGLGRVVEEEVAGSRFIRADVEDADALRALVDAAVDAGGGRLGALVNNAGQTRRVRFATSTVADWDHLMRVNARSVYLVTRYALDALIAGRGAVVNIASVAGAVGEEELSGYSASKAAVIALTQSLAIELGSQVRFNAICPGQVGTDMMTRVLKDPALHRASTERVPVGHVANPAEIGELVAFLASPKASFVNGSVIVIDGGETAGIRVLPGAEAPR